MKQVYQYSGKKFIIEQYNTSQEKDILILAATVNDDTIIDTVLRILNIDESYIENLTEDEKIAIIIKHRIISVSDLFSFSYTCSNCNKKVLSKIRISDVVTSSNITDSRIIDRFKEVKNPDEFICGDVNDIDLDEYEDLCNKIKNQVTKFKFHHKVHCSSCKFETYIKLREEIIEFMSEDSYASIMTNYNNLIFSGKYSKTDIDSMYPFERAIFIELYNTTIKGMK